MLLIKSKKSLHEKEVDLLALKNCIKVSIESHYDESEKGGGWITWLLVYQLPIA